jgi:hypothetical protein
MQCSALQRRRQLQRLPGGQIGHTLSSDQDAGHVVKEALLCQPLQADGQVEQIGGDKSRVGQGMWNPAA